MTREAKRLISLISERYEVDALTCDAIFVEWGVLHMAATEGNDIAAKAWKRLNARRARLGKYTSIPTWNSPLCAAYFGTHRRDEVVDPDAVTTKEAIR
jgi:hypothetical protein